MANRFDPTIDKLINSQTQFVNGVAPVNFARSTVPLTNAFRPNLDQALNTGFRSDTGAAGAAGESAANRLFGKTTQGIDERMAAKGLTGSSAQSGQVAQAGSDLSAQLGEMLARLNFDADEAASNRRVKSFDSALGEGTVANQSFANDTARASVDLAGRTQQAGAGQDLLSSLLAQFQPDKVASTGFTSGVNNYIPPTTNMVGTSRGGSFAPAGGTHGLPDAMNPALRHRSEFNSGFGLNNPGSDSRSASGHNDFARQLNNVNTFGQQGAGGIEQQMIQALGAMFSQGNAATGQAGAQIGAQNNQNAFINDLIQRFGTNAAGLGR